MRTIRRVAVLGAGTMGSRIAAHFANAGVPALLLDLVRPGDSNRSALAQAGIETAAAGKPGAFFSASARSLVTPGNFEDDLGEIQYCDWVVEAVAEKLDIKRSLLEKVALWRRPDTIISTNTSGIPLAGIADGFSPEFRRNFLGTHFFNPPRYLYLLEMIPGPDTDPEVFESVAAFCDVRLGKGIVRAKDTPNFIGNRIGAFFSATVQHLMVEGGYTVEEADALTGPLIGLPRSASFRLIDIIGLDIWDHVSRNIYDLAPDDPWRERFRTQEFAARMLEKGWLGDKTRQGFYKRGPGKELWALDWKTLEYRPAEAAPMPELEDAKRIERLPERLRALVDGGGRAGTFLWKLFSDVFLYAAGRAPGISDRIVEIDRAMRWGFAHTLGPFELWDALGVEETVARLRDEKREVPEAVERMLASEARSFYRFADHAGHPRTEYFDFAGPAYVPLEGRPGVLAVADIKRARGVVRKNSGASLIDLDDGVLCIELHGKKGVLGDEQFEMLCAGIDEAARNFTAVVIAGTGEGFSTGQNLALLLRAARESNWSELDAAVRRHQDANLGLKYAARPVVAAPFGTTLAGGCVLALHAARIQTSAELYIGLSDLTVGLIPSAGGTKELLLRVGDAGRAMDAIVAARTSASAQEARETGWLRPVDQVSMNPDRVLADAKALTLSLVPGYAPGQPRTEIPVAGEPGYALLRTRAWLAHQAHRASEYDLHLAAKLAYVLCGGRLTGRQCVSEQHLLDLEREAFLSLCGETKTQERMEAMLKTGKPLRN